MKPMVIDLFAGAGLFSSAFQSEGFQLVYALECDSTAVQTYIKNLGTHIECGEVGKKQPTGKCDVLIAGPPCQGFSTLGKRILADPRNKLSLEIVSWAAMTRPKVVVIENVPAFTATKIWRKLANQLKLLGYKVAVFELNAASFGVAQNRTRAFTIASRVALPEKVTSISSGTPTVRDAWIGLDPVPNGKNFHFAPAPSDLALARMSVIPPGGNKSDIMKNAPELAPPSWWKMASQATDVWGRMEWEKPSNTLRTALQNPSKGRYIHPEQNRVITLREASRLHSIPDNWEYCGKPTQIARQIGNGVPPLLGRAVARVILSLL